MRTFVMGDIHGTHKAMLECFEKSGFDRENDQLIQLGDVCDGYPDVKESIDALRSIKHLIQIIGNHDKWFLDWATAEREIAWATQGGQATFESYIPKDHIDFFRRTAHAYWIDEKNRLFVHGGFDLNQPDMKKQEIDLLMWDRRLVTTARKKEYRVDGKKLGGFEEIFVGHTSTTYSCGGSEPRKFCNLWMMDTGAGFEGKLTIMDIDSHEFWQSDYTHRIYPNSKQAELVRFQLAQKGVELTIQSR